MAGYFNTVHGERTTISHDCNEVEKIRVLRTQTHGPGSSAFIFHETETIQSIVNLFYVAVGQCMRIKNQCIPRREAGGLPKTHKSA